MATYVDVLVSPIAEGLRDDGPHRSSHATVYRTFTRTTDDPRYPSQPLHAEGKGGQGNGDEGAGKGGQGKGDQGKGDQGNGGEGNGGEGNGGEALGDAEDRHALLRGLFLTGFLADAWLDADNYLGAEQVIVLSASSKTAIAFADQASKRPLRVIGITAPGNVEFVRSLGCYSDILTYDEITTLPVTPSVSVDMAGHGAALEAVHTHLGDQLLHSMIIGKSHHDSPPAEFTAGPAPQFFFAPTAAGRLLEQWGPEEFQRRSNESTHDFVSSSGQWLTVHRTHGPDAAAATWQEVYDGSVPPSIGRIISLHD